MLRTPDYARREQDDLAESAYRAGYKPHSVTDRHCVDPPFQSSRWV